MRVLSAGRSMSEIAMPPPSMPPTINFLTMRDPSSNRLPSTAASMAIKKDAPKISNRIYMPLGKDSIVVSCEFLPGSRILLTEYSDNIIRLVR